MSALPYQAFPSGAPPFPVARFTVEQYHRMVASGAFSEDDRLELIDGWVIAKMAKGPAHEYATGRGEELLRVRVPVGWHVRNQSPITLPGSEPEPDLSVVRGSRGEYRDHHPNAQDVALLVEVSDTSLVTDRVKGRVYGAAGIAEYWIVNIEGRCLERHRGPSTVAPRGYTQIDVLAESDELCLSIAGQDCGTVIVSAFLP